MGDYEIALCMVSTAMAVTALMGNELPVMSYVWKVPACHRQRRTVTPWQLRIRYSLLKFWEIVCRWGYGGAIRQCKKFQLCRDI